MHPQDGFGIQIIKYEVIVIVRLSLVCLNNITCCGAEKIYRSGPTSLQVPLIEINVQKLEKYSQYPNQCPAEVDFTNKVN